MTSLIHRRSFLRGLFAAPAIVAASSLMPIRGTPLVVVDSITRFHQLMEYCYRDDELTWEVYGTLTGRWSCSEDKIHFEEIEPWRFMRHA